eukprot:Nitzschia sp. Nitz4//scaffold232_size35869//26941//27466//NITZ4_007812-RA/size35869-snap-gene-0.53-mRNA-1//-1//CDS//3329543345//6598//frame0
MSAQLERPKRVKSENTDLEDSIQPKRVKSEPTVTPMKEEEVTSAAATPSPVIRNDDGDACFELSDKRRVSIRKFKGKSYVDIREMYSKDGKMLPGKKGISLTKEQYDVLRDIIVQGHVDKELEALEAKK